MLLIGNKTHGDLAEIAIAEFINQHALLATSKGHEAALARET